jgi:hypothetical protein
MKALLFLLPLGLLAAPQVTVTERTLFKTQTKQGVHLDESEKCLAPKGKYEAKVLGFSEAHLRLRASFPGCPFEEGYLYQKHLEYRGWIPGEVKLHMPYYFYQWHNENFPSATCGITSAAMLLSRELGQRLKPDALFRTYGGYGVGQSPERLEKVYRDFSLQDAGSTRFGSFEEIAFQINRGAPVVAHGYFTRGHIVLISGYNSKGFIVQDPAGEWARYNYGGYPNAPYDPLGGRDVLYTYGQMKEAIYEPSDQSLWMSWGRGE